MSAGSDYALTDFSTTAENRTVSLRSRISDESFDESPLRNPFTDQTEVLHNNQHNPASGNHLLSSQTQQNKAHGETFFGEWTVEWTAWLVAATSLVALIILFAIYSEKPLRQWKADITPGTAVAILSQLGQTSILAPVVACICQSMWLWLDKESHQVNTNRGQASLIMMQRYDDGSRGPISSLFLLWNRPDVLLVWLGTVNTLLIIIFGSFAQQSLQLPTREFNVTKEGDNLIPRALQYQAPQPAVSQLIPGTPNTFTYESVADLMSLAIVDGLLRKDISPSDVMGSCVTGNCTWEDYQSLGVYSTVTDVSSTITSTCRKRASQFNPAGCNYSVPAIDENPIARESVLQTSKFGQTLWLGASNPMPLENDYEPPALDTLVQFYVIYVPDLTRWDDLDVTEDHKDELVALQATLSLCLNTYHANMTFGVTSTQLLSQETNLDWQTGTESFEGTESNRNPFHNYLSLQTFTGSASMRSEGPDGGGNFTENDVVRRIAASLYDDRAGIRGLSESLDNLAISMSNALRTTTDILDNFPGTSTSFEVYIQIEWAWMIVPITTVILSLIFLLITIHQSRQRKIPAWKSSLLAVLLGLSSETRSDLGGIIRTKEMEEMAKKKNVRLESNGGQWQIVKADQQLLRGSRDGIKSIGELRQSQEHYHLRYPNPSVSFMEAEAP
ncbi:MAG: hypothetical protein Q9176_007921 [Flavoplaca citrina]